MGTAGAAGESAEKEFAGFPKCLHIYYLIDFTCEQRETHPGRQQKTAPVHRCQVPAIIEAASAHLQVSCPLLFASGSPGPPQNRPFDPALRPAQLKAGLGGCAGQHGRWVWPRVELESPTSGQGGGTMAIRGL